MDPTDCPEGFATDQVFRLYPGVKCDTNLAIYWAVTGTISLLKFLHVIMHHREWMKKHRKGNKPVGTIIFAFSFVVHLIQYILYGLNVANCLNGWSLSLYSICFSPDAWQITILLKRCVSLGASVTRVKGTTLTESQAKKLKSFGLVGKILFVSQLICLIISNVVLIIVSPIIPESQTAEVGKVGFAFKCSFLSLAIVGIIYQIQRVISAFRSLSTAESERNNMAKARHKLLLMQILVGCLFSVPLVYLLLVIDAITWTWWAIVAIPQGVEATVNFLGGIPTLVCGKGKKDQSTQPPQGIILSVIPESGEVKNGQGRKSRLGVRTVSDFKSHARQARMKRRQRMSRIFKLRIPKEKPFSLMSKVTEEPTQTGKLSTFPESSHAA